MIKVHVELRNNLSQIGLQKGQHVLRSCHRSTEAERLPERVSRFLTQGFLVPFVAQDNRSKLLRHNLLIDKHEKKSVVT